MAHGLVKVLMKSYRTQNLDKKMGFGPWPISLSLTCTAGGGWGWGAWTPALLPPSPKSALFSERAPVVFSVRDWSLWRVTWFEAVSFLLSFFLFICGVMTHEVWTWSEESSVKVTSCLCDNVRLTARSAIRITRRAIDRRAIFQIQSKIQCLKSRNAVTAISSMIGKTR